MSTKTNATNINGSNGALGLKNYNNETFKVSSHHQQLKRQCIFKMAEIIDLKEYTD